MMRFVLVLTAVALTAGLGWATDLVITDAATVMDVWATAEGQVIRTGDPFGTWRGFTGFGPGGDPIYDTLYEAVYVARRPE